MASPPWWTKTVNQMHPCSCTSFCQLLDHSDLWRCHSTTVCCIDFYLRLSSIEARNLWVLALWFLTSSRCRIMHKDYKTIPGFYRRVTNSRYKHGCVFPDFQNLGPAGSRCSHTSSKKMHPIQGQSNCCLIFLISLSTSWNVFHNSNQPRTNQMLCASLISRPLWCLSQPWYLLKT